MVRHVWTCFDPILLFALKIQWFVASVLSPQCYTKQGLELTRVTVIDSEMKVIYDTFVKPESKVVDYNTRWVGNVTPRQAVCCFYYSSMRFLPFFRRRNTCLNGDYIFKYISGGSVCLWQILWCDRGGFGKYHHQSAGCPGCAAQPVQCRVHPHWSQSGERPARPEGDPRAKKKTKNWCLYCKVKSCRKSLLT